MEPSTAQSSETIDELPFTGRLVAYVFLGVGLAGLFKIAFFLYDGRHLNVSFLEFACLYVGWGLLRGRRDAPGCAGTLAGCLGVGIVLTLVAAAAIALVAWSQGESPKFHFEPTPLFAIAAFIALAIFAFWSHGVLKRPDVRGYCDGGPNKEIRRRFRLEHLLALMAMVAFAAVGVSPRTDHGEPKSYRRAINSIDQAGLATTGTLYEVVEAGEAETLLHVVVVIDTAPNRVASSLEVNRHVAVLKTQGQELLLNPNYRVHVYRDGAFADGVESLSHEQWDAYEASKQRAWTLEEIESFLELHKAKTLSPQ